MRLLWQGLKKKVQNDKNKKDKKPSRKNNILMVQ